MAGKNGKIEKGTPKELKIGIFDPVGEINNKFDLYIKFVVGVLLVAVITMIFMVSTLILDAFHFNSATYKEYSEKIDALDILQKSNQSLFEANKQNQEIIIQQQMQIKKLLESK